MTNPLPKFRARVLGARQLSATGFELRIERCGMTFRAGQEIMLHGPDPTFDRVYSIASSEQDDHLLVLYRVIPEGKLTPLLSKLKPGDEVPFTGPFGSFVLRDADKPIVFVATGTGIAPCASFIRTHPNLRATILHGVRTSEDLFYRDVFASCRHLPCVSRQEGDWFHGRVSALLPTLQLPADAHYYLCGFNGMITEVSAQLRKSGVNDDCIFSEPYYYW